MYIFRLQLRWFCCTLLHDIFHLVSSFHSQFWIALSFICISSACSGTTCLVESKLESRFISLSTPQSNPRSFWICEFKFASNIWKKKGKKKSLKTNHVAQSHSRFHGIFREDGNAFRPPLSNMFPRRCCKQQGWYYALQSYRSNKWTFHITISY